MKKLIEKMAAAAREAAAASPPAVTDGRMTRAQAASYLGIGYNTVKRLDGSELHPVRDAHGTYWYPEEEVHALARKYEARRAADDDPAKHYDGETAAQVFRMLDERKPVAEIVIALKLRPAVARALAREWGDLRGAIFVGAESLARISTVPCLCPEDGVRTEEDLLRALENANVEDCDVCHKNAPRVCVTCIIHRGRQVIAFAKAEKARWDARAKEEHDRRVQAEAAVRARRAAQDRAEADPPRERAQYTQGGTAPTD